MLLAGIPVSQYPLHLCGVSERGISWSFIGRNFRNTHLDSDAFFRSIFILDNPAPNFSKSSLPKAPISDDDLIQMNLRHVLDLSVGDGGSVELIVDDVAA